MTGNASVLFEETDSVATIRIDDGKANALNEGLLSALSDALDVAIAQDRAAMLVGREGFLSAGFDLSVMRADPEARKETRSCRAGTRPEDLRVTDPCRSCAVRAMPLLRGHSCCSRRTMFSLRMRP